MMKLIVAILVALIPMAPAVVYYLRQRRYAPARASRGLIWGLTGLNVVLALMAVGIALVWLASPTAVGAAGLTAQAAAGDPYASLAAAIATGLAAVGAGIAVSGTGAAAVGAIAEKPEAFGRSLIFVGLAEGIAIYGLLVAFLVLNR
jgi:V/A-type H+-transporting ATPase subunit K